MYELRDAELVSYRQFQIQQAIAFIVMPLVLDPVCLYVCTYSRCVLNSHLFRWLCKEPDYSLNAGVYVHFI